MTTGGGGANLMRVRHCELGLKGNQHDPLFCNSIRMVSGLVSRFAPDCAFNPARSRNRAGLFYWHAVSAVCSATPSLSIGRGRKCGSGTSSNPRAHTNSPRWQTVQRYGYRPLSATKSVEQIRDRWLGEEPVNKSGPPRQPQRRRRNPVASLGIPVVRTIRLVIAAIIAVSGWVGCALTVC